jgi:hypothetical protein
MQKCFELKKRTSQPGMHLFQLGLFAAGSKVNNDKTIEFDGRSYQIAPTPKRHVPILIHPEALLGVLETKPSHI